MLSWPEVAILRYFLSQGMLPSKDDHGSRLETLEGIKDTEQFLGFADYTSGLIPLFPTTSL